MQRHVWRQRASGLCITQVSQRIIAVTRQNTAVVKERIDGVRNTEKVVESFIVETIKIVEERKGIVVVRDTNKLVRQPLQHR